MKFSTRLNCCRPQSDDFPYDFAKNTRVLQIEILAIVFFRIPCLLTGMAAISVDRRCVTTPVLSEDRCYVSKRIIGHNV